MSLDPMLPHFFVDGFIPARLFAQIYQIKRYPTKLIKPQNKLGNSLPLVVYIPFHGSEVRGRAMERRSMALPRTSLP